VWCVVLVEEKRGEGRGMVYGRGDVWWCERSERERSGGGGGREGRGGGGKEGRRKEREVKWGKGLRHRKRSRREGRG